MIMDDITVIVVDVNGGPIAAGVKCARPRRSLAAGARQLLGRSRRAGH